jgi:hypothetical protein
VKLRVPGHILFALVLFSGSNVWASMTGSYYKGVLVAHLEASTFTTKENYLSSGEAVSLAPGQSFTEIAGRFQAAYDFADWWSLYSDFGFKRNRAVTPLLENVNTGFADIGLGANMLAWSGFVKIIPDIYVSIPTYAANGADGGVLLGDGALALQGRVFLTKTFRQFLVSVYGGIKLRGNGLSTQVPVGLHGVWDFRRFFILGSVQSLFSLNDDKNTDLPVVRTSVTERLAAGSFAYNAVNPSATTASLSAGWKISPHFSVTLGADQTIMGTNAAKATRFLVGITFADLLTRGKKAAGFTEEGREQLEKFVVEPDPEPFPTEEKPGAAPKRPQRKKRVFGPY